MGVCYCSCGHSSKSHVFPNIYVQEYKKLYNKTIAEAEKIEKEEEQEENLRMKLEWSREAHELRKWAQEYLNILKQIE